MPWTQIPLGTLRKNCPEWRTERACRALAVLPFMFSSSLDWQSLHDLLAKLDEKLQLSKVTDILLLVPDESLDMVPFSEWKRAETEAHVVTAYWHLSEDQVLWAEGFHDRASVRQHGRTLEQHAGIDPAS
jgi:hypothetical protein